MSKEYEVTIKVSEDDFYGFSKGAEVFRKVENALKEVKAKEIKVGDWIIDMHNQGGPCIFQTRQEHLDHSEWSHCIKLPQRFQDGLTKFINEETVRIDETKIYN